MNGIVDAGQAFAGGLGAVLTPALALPVIAVGIAGLTFGRALDRRHQAVVVAVLVVIVAAATWRRGVGAEGVSSVVAGAIGFTVLGLFLRGPSVPWWRAAAGGLALGVTAVLWRVEAFGPVLAELRGPWQSAPASGLLAIYHLATALALGAVYWLGSELGRLVPSRVAWAPWWAVVAVSALSLVLGLWPVLVRTFMLKWPHVPFG